MRQWLKFYTTGRPSGAVSCETNMARTVWPSRNLKTNLIDTDDLITVTSDNFVNSLAKTWWHRFPVFTNNAFFMWPGKHHTFAWATWLRSSDIINWWHHDCLKFIYYFPTGIYLFKVDYGNTRPMSEIRPKLIIKTPELCQRWCSGVFIVNFGQI